MNKIYNYNNPVDVAEAFLAAKKKNEKPIVEVKNNENNDKKFFFKNIIFFTNDREEKSNKTLKNLKEAIKGTDVEVFPFIAEEIDYKATDTKIIFNDNVNKYTIDEQSNIDTIVITRLGAQDSEECIELVKELQDWGFFVLNPIQAAQKASNKYTSSVLYLNVNQHSFIVLVFILPMWMNFLLRTLAWQTLLEKTGVINSILGFLHLPTLNIINTPYAIVLGMVYNFLPFMVLPLYNVLVKIDKNVINAARDLGANSIQTFFKVILPLSVPGIISGITMVFVPALTTFVISTLLGGSKILLIGNVIEQEFTQTGNWNQIGRASCRERV